MLTFPVQSYSSSLSCVATCRRGKEHICTLCSPYEYKYLHGLGYHLLLSAAGRLPCRVAPLVAAVNIITRARICKCLWSPGIDSEESIPPAYVAWRTGTTNRVIIPARQAGNQFMGSLKGLQIRAQMNYKTLTWVRCSSVPVHSQSSSLPFGASCSRGKEQAQPDVPENNNKK